MQSLTKAQLKYLRKLAQKEKPIFQLGKLGITETFIDQFEAAINRRELIKFNILQNSEEEIGEATHIIAEAIGAEIVQTIGHTGVLFRESTEEKYRQISTDVKRVK